MSSTAQMTLLEIPTDDSSLSWRPPESLPELSQYDHISLDTEHEGKDQKTVPGGISLATPDKKKWYIPLRHKLGGNLDEGLVKRWFKREVRDKKVSMLQAKHDVAVLYNGGFNLEEQNCQIRDVAFNAALLNEHRYSGLDLDSLGKEFLGRGKKELKDKSKMMELPAGMVGPYAEEDALLTMEIDQATMPLIIRDELERVLDLENSLIYCTVEMERNGGRLDLPKLARWREEATHEFGEIIMEIWKATGMKLNPNPGSADLPEFFNKLGIPEPASFDEIAMEQAGKRHPLVMRALQARRIASVKSKYLDKYWKQRRGEFIYYQLHQLKNSDGGTITGRYSSAAPSWGGCNIQQVPRVGDQIDQGIKYLVRELFIPEEGFDFFASDAKQIEYRLFGHYANSPKLNAAYAKDPETDFHNLVMEMIRVRRPTVNRKTAKEGNFATIYGAGAPRLAETLRIDERDAYSFLDDYNAEFPEAKRLMNEAMAVAQRREYVKDFLGRRGRFKVNGKLISDKFHSALNKIIQGGAATYNKLKLRHVYAERKTVGIHKLRATVHDEVWGDIVKDPVMQSRFKELMDVQEHQLRIPILWDTHFGANWKECK